MSPPTPTGLKASDKQTKHTSGDTFSFLTCQEQTSSHTNSNKQTEQHPVILHSTKTLQLKHEIQSRSQECLYGLLDEQRANDQLTDLLHITDSWFVKTEIKLNLLIIPTTLRLPSGGHGRRVYHGRRAILTREVTVSSSRQ